MPTFDIAAPKPFLGDRLVADGLITPEQLELAFEHHIESECFLGQSFVSLGFLKPKVVGKYLTESTGFPFVDLSDIQIDAEVARSIPESVSRRHLVLPFLESEETVHLAMADPLDLVTLDNLRGRLKKRVIPYIAFEQDLTDATNRVYDGRQKTQSVLDEIAEEDGKDPELSVDTLLGLAEDAPIVRLVNSIVGSAVASGASDIHIEPQEGTVRVRYRIDGLLYEQAVIPRRNYPAVVSRIKIISGMNIAERRRPQDGRFAYKSDNGAQFDLRVSILPLIYGEKVVMRLLAKQSSFANSATLGFFPPQKKLFEEFITRPHGIMLVTGPTGSGKSTTLFAALNQINDSIRNINTVEDPVEYNMPGVNQMQINTNIGVTFAAGLRTLLRQDPDVVMVGEIRDRETAEIAVQAALTGHLVLSTLHTNSAAGALTRLQNMGIEPFLVSSALIGVIGQRLLRTICPNCKEPLPANKDMLRQLKIDVPEGDSDFMLTRGAGCEKCSNRGMKGRTAVYEIMSMTDQLREMVLAGASGDQLQTQAETDGMMTMRMSGIEKVKSGITTPEEVMRVLFAEDF
ncbi:MAG: GspE/PulE family protein [Chthonomonadales bacterium]